MCIKNKNIYIYTHTYTFICMSNFMYTCIYIYVTKCNCRIIRILINNSKINIYYNDHKYFLLVYYLTVTYKTKTVFATDMGRCKGWEQYGWLTWERVSVVCHSAETLAPHHNSQHHIKRSRAFGEEEEEEEKKPSTYLPDLLEMRKLNKCNQSIYCHSWPLIDIKLFPHRHTQMPQFSFTRKYLFLNENSNIFILKISFDKSIMDKKNKWN